MLSADRIFVLGEALAPPVGYQADALIAATYSLDLPMALALPLAMLRGGELAGETFDSVPRIEVFEALRRLVPSYRVFCDASGVYPPPRRRLRILPLLDQVIVPLAMPPLPNGRRPTFHPKLILVRFVCEGAPARLRAVCMSRNLTSDSSLDVSVMLEGEETGSSSTHADAGRLAEALQQLLTWTVRPADADRSRALIDSIGETVRRTGWRPPSEFASCRFCPLGFAVEGVDDPTLLQADEDRMLVVSPFLSAQRLERLTARGKRHVLVSEQDALHRVGTRALEGFSEIHRLAPRVGAGSQLHAKLYVAEGRRRTRWLVGSANATEAAVAGNAEFLVELVGSKPRLRIDALLGAVDGMGDLLVTHEIAPDDPPDPQTDPRSAAEEEMRRLAALAFHGSVLENADGRYSLEIALHPRTAPLAGLEAQARLAGTSQTTRLDFTANPAGRLTGLERADLSPFLILTIELAGVSMERTVVLTLAGVDCARLGQEAMRDAVRDPLAYLSYLVTGSDGGTELALTFDDEEPGETASAVDGVHTIPARAQPALLEKLLQMLHGERPDGAGRFDEIGQLIDGFAEQLPPELAQLWATLDRARRK